MGKPNTSLKPHVTRAETRAAFELVLAASLWGFGFIATIWALRSMGPLHVTGWRFLMAAVFGFLLVPFVPVFRRNVNREQFFLAMIPGLLISSALVFQTWGLKFTTATKSSFLTTLYVLLVPMLEMLWLKKKLPRNHMWYVAVALIGTALICQLPNEYSSVYGTELPSASDTGSSSWNLGDFLTIICAVLAGLHILWFEFIHERIDSPYVFNLFQAFWAGAPALLLAFIFEPLPTPNWADLSLVGLLMLAFGSSLIAFMMQVRAQKILPPSLASILFLLESPFATIFAIVILGEALGVLQWMGAAFILFAAGLSVIVSREAPQVAYDEGHDPEEK